MKVVGLYNPDTANGYYRAELPLAALRARGHHVYFHHAGALLRPGYQLPACDVVLIHRACYAEHVEFARACKARGVPVVWDNDDDLSALPKATRQLNGHSRRASRAQFSRSVEIGRQATLMTASSTQIAKRYEANGVGKVQVIENTIAPVKRPSRKPPGEDVVIGYTGALEHADDLKRLRLTAIVDRLLREHPRLRFASVGIDLGIDSPHYACQGYIPFRDLQRTIASFDIGIAPLLPTPFNLSRSDIKLKEYAAAGAMWLASPIGPYRGLGTDEGGMLVGDDGWYAAMAQVVSDYRLRDELTRHAWSWVQRRTIRAAVANWEAALRLAVRTARA